MSILIPFLLVVLIILLVWDLFYQYKILRKLDYGLTSSMDEKYYELKYHLNILKTSAIILISVIGFMGYTELENIKDDISSDIDMSLKIQKDSMDFLRDELNNYSNEIESMNQKMNQLTEIIGLNDNDLKNITEKISSIDESFRYNPRVYIVNGLRFPKEEKGLKFMFSEMMTIYGEPLPKFKNPPLILVQGKSVGLEVLDVTKDYVQLDYSSSWGFDNSGYFEFDLWIGSQEK